MNKYVCKYIIKIDENNLLRIESESKNNKFKIVEEARTNTKVTTSKIMEDKASQSSSKK